MKIYGICDNLELSVGMRLSGMHVDILQEKEEIIQKIKEVISKKDIGILVVSQRVYEIAEDEIRDIRDNKRTPLVVTIPN